MIARFWSAQTTPALTGFDKRVRHYEVAFADFPQITAG
jgi:hypothetical protein